jgi:FkbM family methyltransferase
MLPHDPDYTGVTKLSFTGRESDGILDVGANLGLSALSFRKLLRNVAIVSIEPNGVHEPWLARIKRRDNNFAYHLIGAGAARGSLTLHVPYYKGICLHTMASVRLPELMETCHRLYGHECKHIAFKRFPVTIRPIDELRLSPALIKIDAEGFEWEIIQGARQTIRRARPYLLVENNARALPAIQGFLSPLGYARYHWDNGTQQFSTRASDARNVYFLPETGRIDCSVAA